MCRITRKVGSTEQKHRDSSDCIVLVLNKVSIHNFILANISQAFSNHDSISYIAI